MAGGKGKSTGGKAGPKEAAAKSQKSHSAKAGLQVRTYLLQISWVFFARDMLEDDIVADDLCQP